MCTTDQWDTEKECNCHSRYRKDSQYDRYIVSHFINQVQLTFIYLPLAVPHVNYLPLSENLTFVPKKSAVLCINLTILVDNNPAEKTLSLFLSTEDIAIHVTLNMTVVKIKSLCKLR